MQGKIFTLRYYNSRYYFYLSLTQEQAKIHFGCNEILGVELENQGGQGTAFAHWEHRVVGVCILHEYQQ